VTQAFDLIGSLLENGKLPFHRAGSHRRIYFHDLLAYRERRDHERRKAIERIAKRELEDGTYDQFVPPEDQSRQ